MTLTRISGTCRENDMEWWAEYSDSWDDFFTFTPREKSMDGITTPAAAWLRTLPRYQCHKRVYAVKIKELRTPFQSEGPYHLGDFMLVPEGDVAPFLLHYTFVEKHQPEVGGYYVVDDDGYASYSPAKAFEEGYTRLDNNSP